MASEKERDLWIRFAVAALQGCSVSEFGSEAVDEMVDMASNVADSMLDEIDERYTAGGARKKTKKTRRAPEPPDEEDDDDEDEEEDE